MMIELKQDSDEASPESCFLFSVIALKNLPSGGHVSAYRSRAMMPERRAAIPAMPTVPMIHFRFLSFAVM